MPGSGPDAPLLTGVVEGFYGTPWTLAERTELFEWMTAGGLNTYLYAPKDDLLHRALWREPYGESAAGELRRVIDAARAHGVDVIYGLSPGLDIEYASNADRARLLDRYQQVRALGCRHLALLFDDIPERLDDGALEQWGSMAGAQASVANAVFDWLRREGGDARLLVCPTAYCGRMADAGLGGPDYLRTLGSALTPGIDILWTGPEIVSQDIPAAHLREVRVLLQRKPVIWDNLHANDYDGRRFFCGPYAGRPLEMLDEVAGILSNPNGEHPLNAIAIRTLAAFVRQPASWDPRRAYLAELERWAASFAMIDGPAPLDDLTLFGDCFYLPHEDGERAAEFYARVARVVTPRAVPDREEATRLVHEIARLKAFCGRLTNLHDRRLFGALCRRAWELREELDLVERMVRARLDGTSPPVRPSLDQPGTYRGSFLARLERLADSGAGHP
jgi:protein O-GlcNAcase/histone acetyltransferase